MAPIDNVPSILWLDSVDSTNNAVRQRLASLDNLSIIAAKSQTAGRGQGDHVWFSTPGLNLTFSVRLKFAPGMLRAVDERIINSFVTPAMIEFLAEEGVEAHVKFPNDIWVADRKICGILVENILDGPFVSDSIVGIGLNLNEESFPSELPNPVSLRQLTGKEYPPERTLERISMICKKNWDRVFMLP